MKPRKIFKFQMFRRAVVGAIMGVSVSASALGLIDGRTLAPLTPEESIQGVLPGDVVVLGELHGQVRIAEAQLEIMRTLRAQGLKVSVGMEFFEYPNQEQVNAWRNGSLPEDSFLQQIGWGSFPFAAYRGQALFPEFDSFVLALNAPRSLTGKIAKQGLQALTPSEAALLPPSFSLGNTEYRERFAQLMGAGHGIDPAALERYFTAQSTWDDTMAWKSSEFIRDHSDQVLVIVVGEFHVGYGGGLPDRLKARGLSRVHTFSFVNLHGLTEEEQDQELSPLGKYGPRADRLWTFDF